MGYKENPDTAEGFMVTDEKDWSTFKKQEVQFNRRLDLLELALLICHSPGIV